MSRANQIRKQAEISCLRVSCDKIGQRERAYKVLFDYAQAHHCPIVDLYEKYTLINGRMMIEIMGVAGESI